MVILSLLLSCFTRRVLEHSRTFFSFFFPSFLNFGKDFFFLFLSTTFYYFFVVIFRFYFISSTLNIFFFFLILFFPSFYYGLFSDNLIFSFVSMENIFSFLFSFIDYFNMILIFLFLAYCFSFF